MRKFVEFTKAFYGNEPVLIVPEDVCAVFYTGADGERRVTINVLGGAIQQVNEDYETVKKRLSK